METFLTVAMIAAVGVVGFLLLKPKAAAYTVAPATGGSGVSDAQAMWGGLSNIAGYVAGATASGMSDYYSSQEWKDFLASQNGA